jgi:hypothetical protein
MCGSILDDCDSAHPHVTQKSLAKQGPSTQDAKNLRSPSTLALCGYFLVLRARNSPAFFPGIFRLCQGFGGRSDSHYPP